MKHLLSTRDLDLDQAEAILSTAQEMADVLARPLKKLPTLRGRTIVNAFFEDSTRTRTSFDLAAKRLSADTVTITAKGSSVSKGESLRDTLLTVEAMGVDAFVIRDRASGSVAQAAGWVNASVVNAGDGWHEHPTQALLDAFTIRRHLRRYGIDGPASQTVVIVGDLLHSRVVRSNVWLLHTLGAHVVLVAPPTLMPPGAEQWPVTLSTDFDSVLADADIVMMLRVQRERMSGGFFPSEREYTHLYGLTPQRLAALKPTAGICHPGPMNRGLEISSAAADAVNSLVLEQVAAGVAVRMSVLYHILGGNDEGER